MGWFDTIRAIMIFVGAVPALIFPAYYHLTATWYREPMGRFLMAAGLGLASLYSAGVVARLLPNETLQEAIRSVLVFTAAGFAWYQLWLYHRVRREELRRRKGGQGDGT